MHCNGVGVWMDGGGECLSVSPRSVAGIRNPVLIASLIIQLI